MTDHFGIRAICACFETWTSLSKHNFIIFLVEYEKYVVVVGRTITFYENVLELKIQDSTVARMIKK